MKTIASDRDHWKDQILKSYMGPVVNGTECHLLSALFNVTTGSHSRYKIQNRAQ